MKRLLALSVVLFYITSTPLILCAESDKKDELKTALIVAEMYSFSLERMIFDFKDNFKTRTDVYEFFKQGFGPSIAEKLTDNIWSGDKVELRPGDEIMESPDTVNFKSITPNSAVISFKTPEIRKHI